MEDRIGALHLHYRIRGGESLGPALIPGFDRAVQAGLAQALSLRLSATLGDDGAVIVVRELNASLMLDKADCALDSRVIDRISRASTDALVSLLCADPPSESLARFPDQVSFVGSFIVALLEGSAWTRWYYGAFHRYRDIDPAQTLRAVLADAGAEAARVFGWLSRRGHLAAVLALVAPAEARRLIGSHGKRLEPGQPGDGTTALVDAAKRLLALFEPGAIESPGFEERVAAFLSGPRAAPNWTDPSSLSEWVMELIRFVQAPPAAATPAHRSQCLAAIDALLAGPLDWLDAPWLAAQLRGHMRNVDAAQNAPETSRRRLLTPRQERILGRVSRALRDERLRIPAGADEDAIVVQLVAAAAADEPGSDPLDAGIIAVIEQAVASCLALERSGAGRRQVPPARDVAASARAAKFTRASRPALDVAAEPFVAGPPAAELLDAVIKARARLDEPGKATTAAGVFLLARAVIDLRLPALALRSGIPLSPLLGALAAKWLGASLPTDEAMALWTGSKSCDLARLDAAGDALGAMNKALAELLIDRGALPGKSAGKIIARDAAILGHELVCSAQIDSLLSKTACLLLRGWAQWLPGVGTASSNFLLQRCVRRAGQVRVSEDSIAVALAPAPLDVVLQMAGYLAPIERVSWLENRSIVFSVSRVATALAP